jgi:hypothetical protein
MIQIWTVPTSQVVQPTSQREGQHRHPIRRRIRILGTETLPIGRFQMMSAARTDRCAKIGFDISRSWSIVERS